MSGQDYTHTHSHRGSIPGKSLRALLAAAVAVPLAAFAQPGEVTYQGAFPGAPAPSVNARAMEAEGKLFDINAVVVTGDRIPVYSLDNWEGYENNALYEPMSEADIESFRQRLLKDLQDNGFLFATVSVYRPSLRLGFLKLRVHVGEKGDVTVTGNQFYSAAQILDSLAWETGGDFNYQSLYDDLFALNSRPRMEVETNLKPRVDADGRRIVDVEFNVEDRFPLHMAWNISNSGIEQSGEWRSRLTAQFLNLIKRDDILTVEWLTDLSDIGGVDAVSASFYAKLTDNWGMTIFTGFSDSNVEAIPSLEIIGEGAYIGAQVSRKIVDKESYSLDLSLGCLFQVAQNTNRLSDGSIVAESKIRTSMPRITVGYAARTYDRFGGRNFISNTIMANFDGQFGSSGARHPVAPVVGALPGEAGPSTGVVRPRLTHPSEPRIWGVSERPNESCKVSLTSSTMVRGVGARKLSRSPSDRRCSGHRRGGTRMISL